MSNTERPSKKEIKKTLFCLALELPEAVYVDAIRRIEEYIDQQDVYINALIHETLPLEQLLRRVRDALTKQALQDDGLIADINAVVGATDE